MHQQETFPAAKGIPPIFSMFNILTSMWIVRSIHVAVELGIADLLKDGPQHIDELAKATGMHAPSLYRLLRALTNVDIFSEVEANTFAQTPLSATLQSRGPGSAYNLARMLGADWEWKTWGELAYSIRTGKPAFDHLYGMDLWHYYTQENPEAGKLFNLAMTSQAEALSQMIAKTYDFSPFHTVVDVGGGQGSLIMAILRTYPTVRGILFDNPAVIEEARTHIASAGLKGRCDLLAGNFLETIPGGADAYIMKSVIHDWDDEHSLKILSNCRQAMKPGGKVLLAELVIGKERSAAAFLDLQMLLEQRGRERTEAEFRALLERAGFKLTRIVSTGPLPFQPNIVEGTSV